MSFPVEASAQRRRARREPAEAAGLPESAIHARPAYKRALERGGAYSFAND